MWEIVFISHRDSPKLEVIMSAKSWAVMTLSCMLKNGISRAMCDYFGAGSRELTSGFLLHASSLIQVLELPDVSYDTDQGTNHSNS